MLQCNLQEYPENDQLNSHKANQLLGASYSDRSLFALQWCGCCIQKFICSVCFRWLFITIISYILLLVLLIVSFGSFLIHGWTWVVSTEEKIQLLASPEYGREIQDVIGELRLSAERCILAIETVRSLNGLFGLQYYAIVV